MDEAADAADSLGDIGHFSKLVLFDKLFESAVNKAYGGNSLDDFFVLHYQIKVDRLRQHRVLGAKRNYGSLCHWFRASMLCGAALRDPC